MMHFKNTDTENTDTEYGAVTRSIHWASAIIIFALCIAGFVMVEMAYGPEKLDLYAIHKSFGLLILLLVVGRIIWKKLTPAPEPLETHAPWEKILAGAAHIFLYAAMIAMPASGWVMSSAGEFPVTFFGLTLPPLMGKNETVFEISKTVHAFLSYGLVAVIGLHVAGAFKHHLIDQDITLKRMLFSHHAIVPYIILIIAGAFFMSVAALNLPKLMQGLETFQSASEQTETPVTLNEQDSAALPFNPADLPPNGWAVDPARTTIGFIASMYGQDFTGRFEDYESRIIFDPDNLSQSRIEVRIRTSSAVTGNADRDTQIVTSNWFASQAYPEAVFRTKLIEHIQGNNYIAIADLTIRDVTLPVSLPFTLTIEDRTATVKASADLNRLDFGIGQGEWANDQTVGTNVRVDIDLTAMRGE